MPRRERPRGLLRALAAGTPMIAFKIVASLLQGQELLNSISSSHPAAIKLLVFAMAFLFSSSSSSITFRADYPRCAMCFEHLTSASLALAYAALLSLVLEDDDHLWTLVFICHLPFVLAALMSLSIWTWTWMLKCFDAIFTWLDELSESEDET